MAKKTYIRGKKRTAEILTLRNDKGPGKITRGIFLGTAPMLRETGEPIQGNFDQELHTMEMADLDTGEVKRYWADGGIRGALKLAKVARDTPIEIEHTGDKLVSDLGKVQTYDIYDLS